MQQMILKDNHDLWKTDCLKHATTTNRRETLSLNKMRLCRLTPAAVNMGWWFAKELFKKVYLDSHNC